MTIEIPRGKSDAVIDAIVAAMEKYKFDHGRSEIQLYRQNSVSVRVRIIDPDFARMDKIQRNQIVWQYLNELPDDIQGDITMLVLLTPDEKEKSFANLEFEDPVPSEL